MRIVDFSLKQRVTVSMVVVVIVILGFISYTKLGLDMLPDLEFPVVSVATNYAGVASEDIEQTVTRPIEQWISTVSKVKKINSISREGQSIIMVEFEWGTNLDFAAQDIRDTISIYETFLPRGISKPMVVKFNLADMPVLAYGVTSKSRELSNLRDYIDNEVATRLERIDGVASAVVISPEETEVQVLIDKGRLESSGISISAVEAAIQVSNVNLPAGVITSAHYEFLLRTIGEFKNVGDIAGVVVGTGANGSPVFLRDLAEIKIAPRDVRNEIRLNGEKGLFMMVTKTPGSNSVLISRAVKQSLEAMKVEIGEDIEFSPFFDMSRVIELMASKSSRNIVQGGILAMLLILFFLRNLRPTLAIGVAIPLSIITTFISFYLAGYTLNLITLAGLALGVGMLVDNAVVVIENIFRHLEEGKSPFAAAGEGASEVGKAIIASTMTSIAVFFPMIFASGVAGKLSQGLALAVSFALLSSLFVSLTIIPMLASWFFRLRRSHKENGLASLGAQHFDRIRTFYGRLLEKALHYRGRVLAGVIMLLILSVLSAVLFLGGEFMPANDQAMLLVKLTMPVGTNVEETDRVIRYLESEALKDPNVITTSIQVGINDADSFDPGGMNPSGSHEAVLFAYLTTSSQRQETDVEILERWRRSFPELEEGRMLAMDMGGGMMGGGGSPIEINVFGPDLMVLKSIADEIKDAISGVEGIRDVKISLAKSKPEFLMRIKKEEAAKLGLSPLDISRQIQTFSIGTVVSRVVLEGEERNIRVRLREEDRQEISDIKKFSISSPYGHRVFLSQVVDFSEDFGPLQIERENQVKKVSVSANYVDRDLSKIVRDVMRQSENVTANLPEGYFIEVGGQFKEMTEAFATMALALLLALVLVYAVMASLFENLKFPFIIMFTIPLAFIGVIFLIGISGKTISLPVFMGFIMLAGIAVNNGIVMVDYVNQLIGRGLEKYRALLEGAVTRLRPIIITTLTTVTGMLPMALATDEGSAMRSPMAIAMIGGLLASMLLTLFVIPIIYSYFAGIKPERDAAGLKSGLISQED